MGRLPNIEALDGFLAALACCPDLIMPSEYLAIIQSGETEDGDLVFEDMAEANRFMNLVSQQWNHVNAQLNGDDVYMPFVLEDEDGKFKANDWAKGFLSGTELRKDIWSEMFEDEERGGSIVPIFGLAFENHSDPELRPFKEPVDDEKREELLIGAAAGVMRMHQDFLSRRGSYKPQSKTYVRPYRKTGRNEPCPCGSDRKFKVCCGRESTLH